MQSSNPVFVSDICVYVHSFSMYGNNLLEKLNIKRSFLEEGLPPASWSLALVHFEFQ